MASTRKATPGLIMVPMSLKPEITVQECDDWYNNEHVPIRMRLPYFEHGYRYRSTETGVAGPNASGLPEWLALYDISDMWKLTEIRYERLLQPGVQSLRESKVLEKISASRRYYDLVSTYQAPDYAAPEDHLRAGDIYNAYGSTVIVVGVRLSNDLLEAESEWNRWYEEDHLPALRKVPGWRRTRRYRTSVTEDAPTEPVNTCSTTEYLTINEFADPAAVGGPEHQIAIRTESRTNVVVGKWRHAYKLHYIQSAAPRHLSALVRDQIEESVSPDSLTMTLAGPSPRIESYVVARDGSIILYMLGGAASAHAPIIVLSTSGNLTSECWDRFVTKLLSQDARFNFQLLRLRLPLRLSDADHALSGSSSLLSTAQDTEDCLAALLMGTPALHLNLRLCGRTTGGPPVPAINNLEKNRSTESEPLAKLCERSAIINCHSSQALDCAMSILEKAALVSQGVQDLWERTLGYFQQNEASLH
ncbi:hypothetical protein CLAIMM_00803 [Cladophialophora immunda]|nr:hypothetical protein CLAIMM_00803 [Cladophialophora immunda]